MNILVVCTGNICRSPMAEGLLRQLLDRKSGLPRACVFSAGTYGLDGEPAAAFAVQAASEMGIDIKGHRARSLDREMVLEADLILAMEPFHRDIILRALPVEEADKVKLLADFEIPRRSDTIEDPYRQPLEAYRDCIERMAGCLEGVVRRLESLACPSSGA